MNTITAKELRDNLGDIAKRVRAGEQIYVSYRSKLAFKLEPAIIDKKPQNPLAGLETYLKAPKKAASDRYMTGNLKELYQEDMANKYGITE